MPFPFRLITNSTYNLHQILDVDDTITVDIREISVCGHLLSYACCDAYEVLNIDDTITVDIREIFGLGCEC